MYQICLVVQPVPLSSMGDCSCTKSCTTGSLAISIDFWNLQRDHHVPYYKYMRSSVRASFSAHGCMKFVFELMQKTHIQMLWAKNDIIRDSISWPWTHSFFSIVVVDTSTLSIVGESPRLMNFLKISRTNGFNCFNIWYTTHTYLSPPSFFFLFFFLSSRGRPGRSLLWHFHWEDFRPAFVHHFYYDVHLLHQFLPGRTIYIYHTHLLHIEVDSVEDSPLVDDEDG